MEDLNVATENTKFRLLIAAQICGNIAVMYQGEIVEQGPVSRIFMNPIHDYTKRLFEAIPGRSWDFSQPV